MQCCFPYCMFCTFTLILPVCMQSPASPTVFRISLIFCFHGISLRHFLNDFEMVPIVLVITRITSTFTFHMHCMSIVKLLHFRIFSVACFITFPSPKVAASINIHFPYSLSQIMMSGLLLGMVLSVCTFDSIICLPYLHVSTNFDTWSSKCSLSNMTPVFLHTLNRFGVYTFANVGCMYNIMWSISCPVIGIFCICCLSCFKYFCSMIFGL